MDDKIKAKLQKLLTLAGNNPSPEEAANAFARAQEIATKHRIELASIEIGEEPADPMVQDSIQENGKRVAGWKKILITGVCRASGVFVVFAQGYGRFELAGRTGEVQTAQYMYAAICAEIERLARVNASGRGRAFVNAYKLGASSVVSERLIERYQATVEAARPTVSETALARVESSFDTARAWYTSETGAKLRKCGSVSSSSADGRSAGRRAGQSINIGGNDGLGRGARAAIGS